MIIPDNSDLFAAYDADQCRALEKLPVCSECGETVQDEYYYEINGEVVCQECLDNNAKRAWKIT